MPKKTPWGGFVLTRAKKQQMRDDHNETCRLCRRSNVSLVYEHDHQVGLHAARGLTCQTCNTGQLAGVDAGRFAIDPATRLYLIEPWYLAVNGERLACDPAIRIAVKDLSANDRSELDRLAKESATCVDSMRRAAPRFEQADLAGLAALGEFRAILRLRHLNRNGLFDLDITEVSEPTSIFQREHLPRVLLNHSHEWAHLGPVPAPKGSSMPYSTDPADQWADIAKDAA